MQAYADGLAAKHFEQQKQITELELAKAEADAKAGSFGNFRGYFRLLLNLAKLWNCLLDLKSSLEFRSLRMSDLIFNF